MNPWRWVDPRVGAVRVADLQAYFLRRGWAPAPNPNRNFLRFETPTEEAEPFYQVIPSSEEFADYRQRVIELVTTLSEREGRHPVAVLEDILQEQTAANGEEVESIRK